ncbi:MAG TPA: hypothetical protein VJL29_16125 [Thermoguttaceae bacterium]|nr:hypothetical protein [Thermoguttaceae bacterium]
MRWSTVAGLLLVLFVTGAAFAGPVGLGGDGCWGLGMRGGGPTEGAFFGGPHSGFWGGGGFGGWRFGWFGSGETYQDRFETKLDDFKTDYDTAVGEDPDFYTSDLYEDMVDKLERWTDRYDRFVTHQESAVDRVDDCIDRINDKIDDLNARLEEGPDEDLPEKWAERFEEILGWKLDFLTDRLDDLTERKDTLAVNLEEYTTFQTDLLAYLDEVINAGNPPAEITDEALSLEDEALSEAMMVADAAPPAVRSVQSVPEPMSIVLLGPAFALLLFRRRSR